MKRKTLPTPTDDSLLFKQICENANDMIQCVDTTGKFAYVNKRWLITLGYSKKALQKMTFVDILRKDQVSHCMKIFQNLIDGIPSENVETVFRSKKGQDIFVEGNIAPRYKDEKVIGGVGVFRDITIRKRAERELRESETRYRELVEKADVAILLDDIKGNFKYFNDNFVDLFGYTYSEMQSKSIEQLVHPDDINKVTRHHRERLKGMDIPRKYEFKGVKKDGTPIWVEVNVVALEDGGEVVGTRSYIWDISERKGAEQDLRTLSMVDELTGLYDRRGFSVFAKQQIRIADRTGKGFFIVFADLDRMKWINDNLGHTEGDQALKDVANVLSSSFRKSDVLARIGGDEFAVVAVDALKSSESIIVGRMLKNISIENSERKRQYQLAISAGAAYYDPTKPCTLDDLLAQADQKMYEHKKHKQKTTQNRQHS